MMKFFLVLALFSSVAFADNNRVLMLEKHARSGFVLPEHSFQKDCLIYDNGNVEVVILTNGAGTGFTAQLTPRKIADVRRNISFARFFPVATGGILCDGGSQTVTAYRKGKPMIIKDLRDCFSNNWRKGFPASRLRGIATKVCGF